jgi:hypothetical protein
MIYCVRLTLDNEYYTEQSRGYIVNYYYYLCYTVKFVQYKRMHKIYLQNKISK